MTWEAADLGCLKSALNGSSKFNVGTDYPNNYFCEVILTQENPYQYRFFVPMRMLFYTPCNNKFPLNDFESEIQKVVIFDDWNYDTNRIPMNELLQLLKGARFTTDQKHESQKIVKANMPVIFISNKPG